MRGGIVQIALVACLVNAGFSMSEQKPLGHFNSIPTNNATYGPVPKEEQIFDIDFLEVAPELLPDDRIIFVWLRGSILKSKVNNFTDSDLANATLDISLSAHFPDGSYDPPGTYTIPLRTKTWRFDHHTAFRNATGDHVDHLSLDGPSDLLADAQIIKFFVRRGYWTFDMVAKLADGTCLFAMTQTQWLDGYY